MRFYFLFKKRKKEKDDIASVMLSDALKVIIQLSSMHHIRLLKDHFAITIKSTHIERC